MIEFDPERLILLVEARVPIHQIADLMNTSDEMVWYAWSKVVDRSVWTLRQIAFLFSLPENQLPTLSQCSLTDMRVDT